MQKDLMTAQIFGSSDYLDKVSVGFLQKPVLEMKSNRMLKTGKRQPRKTGHGVEFSLIISTVLSCLGSGGGTSGRPMTFCLGRLGSNPRTDFGFF